MKVLHKIRKGMGPEFCLCVCLRGDGCDRNLSDRDTFYLPQSEYRIGRAFDIQLYMDGSSCKRLCVWKKRSYENGLCG